MIIEIMTPQELSKYDSERFSTFTDQSVEQESGSQSCAGFSWQSLASTPQLTKQETETYPAKDHSNELWEFLEVSA